MFSFIRKAAKIDMAVLIVGETGTGKELVAREIHHRSERSEGPFVATNMGALPRELVGSELFGHVKGAFTGAVATKRGRFQEALGGTLFLDEISTMDERVQVALLRVLETGKFRRIGGKRDIATDIRVLAASNVDPRKVVRQGTFREDLLHRLQVLRVALPSLRQRKRDIAQLAYHFLDIFRREFDADVTGISREALSVLRAYRWPGNVRELKNVIGQAAVMAERGEITREHLPPRVSDRASRPAAAGPMSAAADGPAFPIQAAPSVADGVFVPLGVSLDDAERAHVLKTLAFCGNNKTRAAEMLGISRKALYDKLARWGAMN